MVTRMRDVAYSLCIRTVLKNVTFYFMKSEAMGHETEGVHLFKNGLIPSQINT